MPKDVGGQLQPATAAKDLRGRQLLLAAMKGEAAQSVTHLKVSSFATVNDLLKKLKDIFVPATGGFKAMADFRSCTQAQGESLLQWSTRCRGLYRQEYPDGDIETGSDLLF